MTRFTRWAMWLMGRGDEASCAEVAEHLQAYLDGQTDPRQLQRIEKHLEHCRRCGLENRAYREIRSALSRRSTGLDPEAVERMTVFGRSLLDERPQGDDPRADG